MQGILRYKKAILISLGILLSFVLIFGASFFSIKRYVEKRFGEKIKLMPYEEAERVLGESAFPGLAKLFLTAYDKAFPETFVHMSDFTFEKSLEAYDYTKEPAVFSVWSVDAEKKTAWLEFVTPTGLAGKTVNTEIRCAYSRTKASESYKPTQEEISAAFQKALAEKNWEELNRVQAGKEISIPGTVIGFLAEALKDKRVESGEKDLRLSFVCPDVLCSFTPESCEISIY